MRAAVNHVEWAQVIFLDSCRSDHVLKNKKKLTKKQWNQGAKTRFKVAMPELFAE